ncbi:unnamed protein product [Schistosoma turkestanicum]|nr:unnamed protein product [Schistosoma turkestanicum]
MVRGSARIKAGGMNMGQDGPQIIKPLALNMSLFQFLRSGYFEKDLLTYCANRLAEYSCTYWLDPTVNGNSYSMDSNLAFMTTTTTTSMETQFNTKYPNYLINQTSMENLTSLKTVKFMNHTDELSELFIGPLNIHKLVQSKDGDALTTLRNSRISNNQLLSRLTIPLILCGSLLNFMLTSTTLRISCRQIPWTIFLFYLIILDQCDLIINAIDIFIESYHEIRLLIALQFLGRFYCQIIPMCYNLTKHIHSMLFVVFTIETLKSCLYPLRQLNVSLKKSKQIARNILILIFVITITLNCQFIWTFDLSRLDTFVLHERIVNSIYKCDFASTWILSPIFLNYIWPLLDHLIGDLFPCIICLSSGIIGYTLYRLQIIKCQNDIKHILNHTNRQETVFFNDNHNEQRYNKNYCFSYHKWIMKIIRGFVLFCLVHGLFLIPRCLYYLLKYFFFISRLINRNNVHNHEMDDIHSQTDQSVENTIIHVMELLRPYEIYLENYESVLRCTNFIEINIRGVILLFGVEEFKSNLYTYLSTMKHYYKRLSLCSLRNRFSMQNTKFPYISWRKNVYIANSDQKLKSIYRTTIDLALNHKKLNENTIELSEYLTKIKHKSNNISNNSNKQKNQTHHFIESTTVMNSQTSLITDTQFNDTIDKHKNNEPDMTKVEICTTNAINSKSNLYNCKKHKSNSTNYNLNDSSSSEKLIGKYHIFYL